MMRRHPLAKDVATIVLAALLLLLPGLAAVDVFSPDEPREAEIGREMRASGDLVVPTFNGCPFLEKPPLFYWCVGLAAKIPLLPDEAIVRLPSVLAAVALLLVTYFLGRELFDRRTGRAGALVLLTTFQFWWYARRGVLDMTLSAFIGAALLVFAIAVRRRAGRDPRWSPGLLALAGASAAGAALTKGLIGLVIPAAAVLAWALWRREFKTLLAPAVLVSAALPALALGVWTAALAARPDGPGFVREFLVENHVKRFLGGGYGGHAQPIWYYAGALATDLLPWVLFLPSAVVGLWPGLGPRAGGRESGACLLLAWLLLPLGILSLASGKRSLYLLPLSPAVALLVAAWWRTRAKAPGGARTGLAVRIPAWALVGLGALVSLALPVVIASLRTGIDVRRAREALRVVEAAPTGIAAGGVLLAAVLATAVFAWLRPRRAAVAALLLAGAVHAYAGAALLPAANTRLSARRFGEAIAVERQRGARIAAFRITEGSLGQFLFYSKGTIDWIGRKTPEPESACCDCRIAMSAEEFLHGPAPRALLLTQEDFDALPPRSRRGIVLQRGRVGSASYVLLAAPIFMM